MFKADVGDCGTDSGGWRWSWILELVLAVLAVLVTFFFSSRRLMIEIAYPTEYVPR